MPVIPVNKVANKERMIVKRPAGGEALGVADP
jgi:hypothetical protein